MRRKELTEESGRIYSDLDQRGWDRIEDFDYITEYICKDCAKEYNIPDSLLHKLEYNHNCGVRDCKNKTDYYLRLEYIELFEIYTDSKTADDIEGIIEEVTEIMDRNNCGFDQIARYAVKVNGDINILVELDVPETVENPTIFMTAYEYSGDIKNYSADTEIACIEFNGDWKSLRWEMSNFAENLIEEFYS
jgi:hypothetical protein